MIGYWSLLSGVRSREYSTDAGHGKVKRAKHSNEKENETSTRTEDTRGQPFHKELGTIGHLLFPHYDE